MSSVIVISILTFSFGFAAFASAQDGERNNASLSSPVNHQNAPDDQDTNAAGATESDAQEEEVFPRMVIRGTVVSADQAGNQLVIRESTNGAERTFAVSQADALKDLRQGYEIWVTPQQNDPDTLEAVRKEHSATTP